MWICSQQVHAVQDMVGTMGTKYYASFLLQEAETADLSEYSGVVEVNRYSDHTLEIPEVEEMLAKNFNVACDDVKILHWARLH